MQRYTYEAILGSGERVEGILRCRDHADAIRKVRELGYHPVQVQPASERRSVSLKGLRQSLRRISVSDLSVFTRQLSSLLNAGLPMVSALRTLSSQCENARLQQIIREIEEALSRDGGTLAEAMDEHPDVFDPVYRGLVRAGEEGGNLVEVLRNLATHLSQAARLRGQVIGAFIYPIFLTILGTVAVFVLMTFVIPRFQVLFDSLGQQLPLPTRMLIGVSQFMASWWWALLAAMALGGFMLQVSLRRPEVRLALDRRLLKLPVFGRMILKLEVSRISRTLGALIQCGVRILDALAITGQTARNLTVRATFTSIAEGVAGGRSLAELFEQAGVYPPMVFNLIRTGEETGELPEMLNELASIYEDEAERAVTGAVKLLEPALIVVMGGIIAGIVASVILPIFQANMAVSQ